MNKDEELDLVRKLLMDFYVGWAVGNNVTTPAHAAKAYLKAAGFSLTQALHAELQLKTDERIQRKLSSDNARTSENT